MKKCKYCGEEVKKGYYNGKEALIEIWKAGCVTQIKAHTCLK